MKFLRAFPLTIINGICRGKFRIKAQKEPNNLVKYIILISRIRK